MAKDNKTTGQENRKNRDFYDRQNQKTGHQRENSGQNSKQPADSKSTAGGCLLLFSIIFVIVALVGGNWIYWIVAVVFGIVGTLLATYADKQKKAKTDHQPDEEEDDPSSANQSGQQNPENQAGQNQPAPVEKQINAQLPMAKESAVNMYNYLQKLDKNIASLALIDVINCYEKLCKTDKIEHKPESLSLVILLSMAEKGSVAGKDDFKEIRESDFASAQIYYEFLKKGFSDTPSGDKPAVLEKLASTGADADTVNRYAVLLYRIAMIIANADGTITPAEKEWLVHLLSFTDAGNGTAQQAGAQAANADEGRDTMEELNSLIGLDSVKTEVEKIRNLLKIQKIREEKGLKSSTFSHHCVFTGNPGTGKTTVARLVAQIYKDLGILAKGHLVETDRSGLVAEYVGQTAMKTNKIIDSALDGVLFIDEAYSLVQESRNDYGLEAISTLLKRMEDNRDRLVVILAGYPTEMKQFIDANPGLQSRFNRYVQFDDYTADELAQIFGFYLKKYDYTLSDDGAARLHEVLEESVAKKDRNFGNARYVRNLFEKTLENQARRLTTVTDLNEKALSEIKAEDINAYEEAPLK